VTLDHCARQKAGGESDEDKPDPIAHDFIWLKVLMG
jgi:hypothetical protein